MFVNEMKQVALLSSLDAHSKKRKKMINYYKKSTPLNIFASHNHLKIIGVKSIRRSFFITTARCSSRRNIIIFLHTCTSLKHFAINEVRLTKIVPLSLLQDIYQLKNLVLGKSMC
jgi:hypothetical protein